MLTRRGPVTIARLVGLPASTVGRVLARHGVPRLADCDPVTGHVIRATRRSANRYEHPRPGSLVHIDVKKLGRIPDGGGWRAHGRSEQVPAAGDQRGLRRAGGVVQPRVHHPGVATRLVAGDLRLLLDDQHVVATACRLGSGGQPDDAGADDQDVAVHRLSDRSDGRSGAPCAAGRATR